MNFLFGVYDKVLVIEDLPMSVDYAIHSSEFPVWVEEVSPGWSVFCSL